MGPLKNAARCNTMSKFRTVLYGIRNLAGVAPHVPACVARVDPVVAIGVETCAITRHARAFARRAHRAARPRDRAHAFAAVKIIPRSQAVDKAAVFSGWHWPCRRHEITDRAALPWDADQRHTGGARRREAKLPLVADYSVVARERRARQPVDCPLSTVAMHFLRQGVCARSAVTAAVVWACRAAIAVLELGFDVIVAHWLGAHNAAALVLAAIRNQHGRHRKSMGMGVVSVVPEERVEDGTADGGGAEQRTKDKRVRFKSGVSRMVSGKLCKIHFQTTCGTLQL